MHADGRVSVHERLLKGATFYVDQLQRTSKSWKCTLDREVDKQSKTTFSIVSVIFFEFKISRRGRVPGFR